MSEIQPPPERGSETRVPDLLAFEIVSITQMRAKTLHELKDLRHALCIGGHGSYSLAVVVPGDWYSEVVNMLQAIEKVVNG